MSLIFQLVFQLDAVRQQSHLPIDVHLMIEQPENYINFFAEHGADMISVHVEATTHIHRAIEQIKQLGKKQVSSSIPEHL